jgi:RNA polymerase sigma factor (sigma-70 family)
MPQTDLVRRLSHSLLSRQLEQLSDRQLLHQFSSAHDHDAFAVLLQRHAGLVLSVCRRTLHEAHLADDAFQATFLLLVRKANSLRQGELLANWLFGVARRISLNLLHRRQRMQQHEHLAGAARSEAAPDRQWDDLLSILDEELAKLPARYRRPLLACYFRELTQDEAATELGLSARTLRRRLVKARKLLRVRLAARGVGLSAGLLLAAASTEKVEANMIEATMRALVSGSVSREVANLAATSAKLTTAFKIRLGIVIVLTVSALVGGFAKPRMPQVPAVQPKPMPKLQTAERRDRFNDPLPPGAIARLGTISLQHAGCPDRVDFSADSKELLSCGNGVIRHWQVETGHEIDHFDFREVGRQDVACCLTEDRKIAVVFHRELGNHYPITVETYYVETRKKIGDFQLPNTHFNYTTPLDSPARLIAVTNEKFDIWDVKAGRTISSIQLPDRNGVLGLCADADKLVTWDPESKISVFDAKTGERLHLIDGGIRDQFERHLLAPGGRWLLTKGFTPREMPSPETNPASKRLVMVPDNFYRVWDLEKGKLCGKMEAGSEAAFFDVAAISPDGRTALALSGNSFSQQSLGWYDIATQKLRATWPNDLQFGSVAALSPDQKTLAVASQHGGIRLWDVTNRREIHSFESHHGVVAHAAFSPDGRSALTIGADDMIAEWKLEDGRQMRRWRELAEGMNYSAYAANCLFAVKADPRPNGRITVWDLEKNREVRDFGPFRPHRAIDLSADGSRLTIVTNENGKCQMRNWDVESGKELNQFDVELSTDGNTHVWPLGDGRQVLTSGGQVSGYDQSSGHKLFHWSVRDQDEAKLYIDTRCTMRPSPDGRQIACLLPKNRGIQIRELDSGKTIRNLECDTAQFPHCYSPNGKLLAVPTNAITPSIIVWEVTTGKKKCEFSGHRGRIICLAFSPDGKKLLSGSEDCTALIWEIEP